MTFIVVTARGTYRVRAYNAEGAIALVARADDTTVKSVKRANPVK